LIAEGEKALLNQAGGTGAFYLAEYRPGDVAIMKKSPTFWKKPLPYLDELQYQFFQDPTAMINALEGGTINLAIDIPNQNIAELSSRFDIFSAPQNFCFEVIQSAKPGRPFANLEARQALQYLVPRERFVQEILFGRGQPAFVHVTHDSIGWEPSFDNTYSYNPSIALEKFSKLDMLGKAPIQLMQLTGVIPTIGALCEMMAAEMTAIGLNVTLDPVEDSEWADRFVGAHAGDFDMMCSYMGRCNRYPTQPVATNEGLFPVGNPCWPGGNPPKAYVDAYNELLHALTPAEQRKWALKLMGADLYYSWDIAVATWGAVYALPKNLAGFNDSRDDYIILDGAHYT
jgi:ABC-type transport system substrate-binding protein